MAPKSDGRATNLILRRLEHDVRARLTNDGDCRAVVPGEVLVEAGDPIEYVCFPEGCLLSAVAVMRDGAQVEVGVIGYEGLLGVTISHGIPLAPHRVVVQVGGTARVLPFERLREVMADAPALQDAMRRYGFAYLAQISQSVACNRLHPFRKRLARWLLTAHDRVRQRTFSIKQEFLAQMLGVKRPRVTEAVSALRGRGFVRYVRGEVVIVDRAGLESTTCECYDAIHYWYEQLLGLSRAA